MTITEERKDVLDFTQPYYFTRPRWPPRRRRASPPSTGLAGQAICVGAATTYQYWLEGTLDLVDAPEPAHTAGRRDGVPAGDRPGLCAQAVQSGRTDFAGWLPARRPPIDAAHHGRHADGRRSATRCSTSRWRVAFDNTVADNDSLVAAVDAIIGAMHADGTLTDAEREVVRRAGPDGRASSRPLTGPIESGDAERRPRSRRLAERIAVTRSPQPQTTGPAPIVAADRRGAASARLHLSG